MDSLSPRPTVPEDVPGILNLIAGIYAEYDCVLDAENDERHLLEPGAYFRAHGGEFWVVEENGVIRATVAVMLHDDAGELKTLYVHPSLRRQGLGRALSEPALTSGAVLRARVRDGGKAGSAFLRSLGFVETGAQLMLHWNGQKRIEAVPMPALRIRHGSVKDQALIERLSSEAWKGAPDAFASRAEEIAQLFGEEGRVVLIAESEGRAMGYLSGVQLGRTLGIEELAVLPEFRRMGIGRALVAQALSREQGAVLSVGESNKPARALYKSLGFTQTARRLIFEKRA